MWGRVRADYVDQRRKDGDYCLLWSTFYWAFLFSQVFKSKEAERFLFVKALKTGWSICSALQGDEDYITSNYSGGRCPASAGGSWNFNKASEHEEDDFEEGGVVVSCSVCNLNTVWHACKLFDLSSAFSGMHEKNVALVKLDPWCALLFHQVDEQRSASWHSF